MGLVELATVSFGQSFQITPIQLITTVSAIINGGNRITPHFGVKAVSADGETIHKFSYPVKKGVLSEETSASMRYILEQVVSEGSGKKAALPGYRIGGKTATSEKLPRSLKKYISSFIGLSLIHISLQRTGTVPDYTGLWGRPVREKYCKAHCEGR